MVNTLRDASQQIQACTCTHTHINSYPVYNNGPFIFANFRVYHADPFVFFFFAQPHWHSAKGSSFFLLLFASFKLNNCNKISMNMMIMNSKQWLCYGQKKNAITQNIQIRKLSFLNTTIFPKCKFFSLLCFICAICRKISMEFFEHATNSDFSDHFYSTDYFFFLSSFNFFAVQDITLRQLHQHNSRETILICVFPKWI